MDKKKKPEQPAEPQRKARSGLIWRTIPFLKVTNPVNRAKSPSRGSMDPFLSAETKT